MSKDLAAIDPTTVPAYIVNHDRAKQLNTEALTGLTGGVPSIRIRNGKFRLKEPGSDDVIIKPTDLVQGLYLPAIIVGVRGPINKSYYAKPYDPNQDEPSTPDCFSFDGRTPDATIKNPIAPACAGCPMNAFGSGRNARGEATKGKACADNKTMAVLYKDTIYALKVPPASLRNLATYLREFDRNGIPYPYAVTLIGFDDESEYSVLTFKVGKFASQDQIQKIEEFVNSREAYEIMNPVAFVPSEAPKQVAAPAPATAPAQVLPPETPAEAKPKKAKATETAEAVPTPPAAAATKAPSQDEIDAIMGL